MADKPSGPPPTSSWLARWTRMPRRWFVAGLIVMAPAAITYIALAWLFNHIDRPLRTALSKLTGYDIPGAGVVMIVVLLLATGAVASTFVLRTLLKGFEATLDRIPLVRTLYTGVKQLVAPLGDDRRGSFQTVVLIQYPDAHNYALGFLINRDAAVSPEGETLCAILVPTNHLHLGNVVLCPASRVHHVDMSAEDGLRFLVSMGAALEKKLLMGPNARPILADVPAPPGGHAPQG